MKRAFLLILSIVTLPLLGVEKEVADPDLLSQALGHLIVRQLNHPGIEFNLDKIIQGMNDERSGKASPLTEEEYEQAIYAVQEKVFLQTSERNLVEANTFLKLNAENKDVQVIEDKLQYKISKESSSDAVVGPESVPLIHYQGKLINGTVFASSIEQGDPISLPIKQTIPGFAKGLVGMKEGEKRILYIHPELAYGVSGHLPPNSLLIFEVEIVKAHSEENQEVVSDEIAPVVDPA